MTYTSTANVENHSARILGLFDPADSEASSSKCVLLLVHHKPQQKIKT